MRPVRKKARLKKMLDARKARRAKGGDQVINTSNTFTTELEPDDPLFQEIVQAQGPMPVGEAVVSEKFEPRNREERKVYRNLGMQGVLDLRDMQNKVREDRGDLAKGVVKGATSGAFEAVRMAPIAGEIIDGAEVVYAGKTGKDFYGNDASATELGAIMGAGLVIPNIVERPLRALGRGAKKFFKIGKKGADDIQIAKQEVDPLFTYDTSSDPLPKRVLDEELKKGLPALSDQSGTQFIRDWYSNPKVRQHFRNVSGSGSKGESGALHKLAYDDYDRQTRELIDAVDINADVMKWRSSDPEMNKIFAKINSFEKQLVPSKTEPGKFTIDYTDEQHQKLGKLWGKIHTRQKVHNLNLMKGLRDKYGSDVIDDLSKGVEASGEKLYTLDPKNIYVAKDLEDAFMAGRTAPDILADFMDEELKRVVPKDAGGVRTWQGVTAVEALDKEGKEAIRDEFRKRWIDLTAAHETNHEATVKFLRSKFSPEASKIREGLSLSVKPEFAEMVKEGSHKGIKEGDEYYASVAELTARAAEMRFNIVQAIKSPTLEQEQQLRAAFNGRIPNADDVFDFLIGDTKNLSRNQQDLLKNIAISNDSGLQKVYRDVLAGDYYTEEKRNAFSNLMKFALMGGVAAGSYGAMDNQGGQPPNSMAAGGVITMRKKKRGMSAIRK